ncbi:MAG: L-2-amino-thiazoline-4-carboxylic acid hydrolase [Lachnospiraceae bacterium]|nr:L-2-amino-thiazoline-4-carboxylic acid hydrolase [Lachnospiraceae bacterium]
MNKDTTIKFMAKFGAKQFKKALKKRNNSRYKALSKEYYERYITSVKKEDWGENDFRLKSFLNMFLGITSCKITMENGYSFEESIAIFDDVAHGVRVFSRWLFKMVDLFPNAFKTTRGSLLDDMRGPSAGCWHTEIVTDNEKEFTYKITKCLYIETCEKYGIRDFCQVFCNHDNWAYGGLQKHVKFVRYSTLVEGDCCHDSFLKID